MANTNPTSSLSEYYKRFWLQFRREIRKAVWEAVIAIVAIIAVVFLQFYYGWINREQGVLSALQNIVPAAAIALAYVVRHLIKTPWVLDVDRQAEIHSGLTDIEALKKQIEAFASEATRPKFVFKDKPSLTPYDEFDEDDRYSFQFDLENNGSRSAVGLYWRVIIAEEGIDEEPTVNDSSIATEIPIQEPLHLHFGLALRLNHPPLIVVIALRYRDGITNKPYSQMFFMRWTEFRGARQIRHLTIDERQQYEQRLQTQLAEFQDAGSQNVGSIPSSKID